MANDSALRILFKHPIIVQPSDIDQMGHANNVVYLRWVQEVAEAHWLNSAPIELRSKYLWVVLHHEIDYLNEKLNCIFTGRIHVLSDRAENSNSTGGAAEIKNGYHTKVCGCKKYELGR